MESTSNERIVKTPGTCGGKARIAGHRVRVQDIVSWHEHQGMTPDQIVSQIPTSPSVMCTARSLITSIMFRKFKTRCERMKHMSKSSAVIILRH